MEDIRRRHAATESTVNGDIFGLEDILNADHRRDRNPALIADMDGHVRVTVDDAWKHIAARGVDHAGALGDGEVGPHGGDFSAANDEGAVFNRALAHGKNRCTLKHRRFGPLSVERGAQAA